MNRREFLKFLGGAAAAAAVVPDSLADTFDSTQAYPVTSPCPASFGTVVVPKTEPACIVFDYTMTLQQAIDSLPKDGGMLILPKGTYIVGESITIPASVQIIAEGNLTISECSFHGAERSSGHAPFIILLDEDDEVLIRSNVFDCAHVPSMGDWFHVPIGEALTQFRWMISGFLNRCLKS